MEPKIFELKEKTLVGMHITMTLADNKTGQLWSSFMPRRKEIPHAAGSDLYSLQVYPATMDFTKADLHTPFEKWAAVEADPVENIPGGMESLTLPAGPYAVFLHKGGPALGAAAFQYIFGTWLPASEFTLDNRPHFELLGAKYKHNEPDSEEEIWIPIKLKTN